MTEKNVADLDRVKKERGLANQSEAVRAALNDCVQKLDEEKEFDGQKEAVLVVNHSVDTEKFVSKTKHSFQQVIKSQNHYCSNRHECVDMFLLFGPAEKIKKMRNAFLQDKNIKKVVLVQL